MFAKVDSTPKKQEKRSEKERVQRLEKQAKKNARPDKVKFTPQEKPEEKSDYTPLGKKAVESRQQKQHKRMSFAVRNKARLPPHVKTTSEVSPLLDKVATPLLNDHDRLSGYAHHHKCPHQRCFNQLTNYNPRYLKAVCDHQYDSLSDELFTCPRCGSTTARKVYRPCGHTGVYCERCKCTSYHYQHRTPNHSVLACACPNKMILMELENEKKHILRTNGTYDHNKLINDFEEFLKVTRSSKPPIDRGVHYNKVVKSRVGIREFLSRNEEIAPPPVINLEEFPALTRVIPEGGMLSAATGAVQSTYKTLSDTIVKTLRSFYQSIERWISQSVTAAFYQSNPILCDILGFFAQLASRICKYLVSRSPTELVLFTACLLGGSAQRCTALTTLLIGVVSESPEQFGMISDGAKYLTTSVQEIFDSFKEDRIMASASQIDEARTIGREFRAKYNIKSNSVRFILNCVSCQTESPDSVRAMEHTLTVADNDIILTSEDTPTTSRVQKEGLMDIMSILVTMMPSKYQLPMFKTVSLFCKDILPVVMVAKHATQFATNIWNWLKKIFGYCLTDTKQWLQLELQIPDSPIRKCVNDALNYRLSAMADLPEAGRNLITAKESLTLATEYIRTENRYDPITIRMITDTEKLITTTVMPPAARKHEPFAVRLYGKPGTGKSRSVPALFGPILGAATPVEFYQKTFSRNMQEYWDGVGTRQCILYDDFGQNRAEPSDLMEFILLISAAPFLANFANISGTTPKGMSIDPKLVIACSNIAEDYTNAVMENAAIHRRFHVRIKVELIKGESIFFVDGGSMTGYTVEGVLKDNFIPKTKGMTLIETQKYLYYAYETFLRTRESGVEKLTEQMKFPEGFTKPLIVKPGENLPLLHKLSDTADYFKSVSKIDPPNYLKQPGGLSYGEDLQLHFNEITKVEQEIGMDFSWCWDALCDCLVSDHMTFYLGAIVFSSYKFIDGMYEGNWRRAAKMLMVPTVTACLTVLIASIYLGGKKVEPESNYSKDKSNPKRVSAEGDGNRAVTDAQAILEKATCRLRCLANNMTLNGVLIGGNFLLTVEHMFVPAIDDGTMHGESFYHPKGTQYELYVPNVTKPYIFEFDRSRLRIMTKEKNGKVSNVDVVVYELPGTIPMRRKIATRFWDGCTVLKDKKGLVLDYKRGTREQIWKETTLTSEEYVWYSANGKAWHQDLMYGTHSSAPGSCGSPVMLATGDTNSPIVGIHVAHNPAKHLPMIIIITREMITKLVPEFLNLNPPEIEGKHTRVEKVLPEANVPSLIEDTNILYLGETKRTMFTPTKTTLRKSLVYDEIFLHTTEPSVLHPNDSRIPAELKGQIDLFKDGIKKMKDQVAIKEEQIKPVLEDMVEWYAQKFYSCGKNRGKPLTFFELLNSGETLKGIDMSTSPGFPFTFENMIRTDLFVRDERELLRLKAPFLRQLLLDLEELERDSVPQWFVTAALKDERRPINKVRVKPKTRFFTVCPIVMILLEKRYFGRFMENLLSSNNVPYAGGVDRLGISWHDMFMDLRKISDRGFGGDYECYDGKISSLLINSATSLMSTAISELGTLHIRPVETDGSLESLHLVSQINAMQVKDEIILKAVRQNLSNPIYMVKSLIFQVNGSLASGCWSTQLIGSLVGEMLQRMAWNELVPKHIQGGYFYKKYVANKIMGDDNINAVELSVTKWYNGEKFSTWLSERNMTYTSADKKGLAKAIEPLEEVSFLKNTTGTMYGYFCPLMEFDAAVEPINWVRTSKYTTPEQALEMNGNSVLRALFFRGRSTYNSLRNRLKELVPKLQFVDFETLKRQYLAYGGFPGTTPETFCFSEEMNQAAREIPNWKREEEDLQQVEIHFEPTLDQEMQDQASDSEEFNMNASKVIQQGNESCNICGKCLSSRNRLIDHIIADHQETDKWRKEETLIGMLREASIGELKQLFAELMGSVPLTELSRMARRHLRDTLYTEKQLVTTLNNMIAFQKNPQVFSTIRNVNANSIPFDLIYQPAVRKPVQCSQRTAIPSILISLITPKSDPYDSDEYERVEPEGGDYNPGETGLEASWAELVDREFGEAEPEGQGISTEEAPIVTDPTASTSKGDPMSEQVTSTRSQGTILSDKDRVDQVVVKMKGTYVSSRAESTLNDQSWSLQNMLEKWYPVANISWDTGSAAGTSLFTADVVKDLIKSSFSGTAFTVFKDFRCAGVKIRATVVASKWHQGRAVVGFSPSMVPSAASAYPRVVSPADLIQMGAVKLDPSQGTSAELYIPFRHPKSYLGLEESDCLGQLNVMVLSQLKAVTSAATEIVIKLFFSLDKPVFKIPRANTLTYALLSELEKKYAKTLEPAVAPQYQRVVAQSGFGKGPLGEKKSLSTQGTMSEKILKSGQPGINEYPREGTPIAARRAVTGDPKTKHFGERETNLINYGKRYRRVVTESATMSANIVWKHYDLLPIINSFWVMHMFNAYRGALNFKVKVTFSPAVANTNPRGTFKVFYEPKPVGSLGENQSAFESATTDVARAEANAGEMLEFQLPYLQRSGISLNPFHYAGNKQSTTPYFNEGRLSVRIESRSTANQVNYIVEVWAAMADEFAMGIFCGVPDIYIDDGLPGWKTARVQQEGLLDTVAENGMNAIMKEITPKNVIGTLISTLDKPAVAAAPEFVIAKNHGFMNFADGPEPIDKFSLHSARQQLTDPEHFGNAENEADFASLFARPNLFGKFIWKTGHVVGDLLTQIDVHPTFEMHDLSITRPSIMCYVAAKFKYWRGGLTFIFEVVGTNFHEGRLDITYHPNTLTVPSNYDTRVSQYTLSCAVKNTENRFAVTAPYLSEEPFRLVHTGQAMSEPSATEAPPACTEFENGVLGISVGAPLRVPDGVPQEVEVLMYVLPAMDFELATPCVSGRSMVDRSST